MTICEDCGQEMSAADGCNVSHVLVAGKLYERIPYGGYGEDASERCPDCGATEGNYHHYGCDNERCPYCRGQMIGCEEITELYRFETSNMPALRVKIEQ